MRFLISGVVAVAVGLAFSFAASSQPSDLERLDRQAQEAYYAQNHRRAAELAQYVLDARRAEVGQHHHSLLSPLSILAGSAELLADYAAAEHHYRDLLDVLEKSFGHDSINSAFGMEALARVLLKIGRVDEADGLYRRVEKARAVMRASGADPFQVRHRQNRARVALARGQWKRAFEEFRASFRLLTSDSSPPPLSNDYLPDLAGEMNAANFLGFAHAAWQLGQMPGQKRAALFDETFELIQLKWRTAAAEALLKAAQRREDTSGGTAAAQTDEETLRRLRAEQEDNLQSWFAKREMDPEYHALSRKFEDANATAQAPGGQAAIMDAANRLLAAYQRCQANPTPACLKDIERLTAEVSSVGKKPAAPGQSSQEIQRRLDAREKRIDGHAEYERRRIDLEIRISQLSAKVGKPRRRTKVETARTPEFDERQALSVARIRELIAPDEALVTYLVGDEGAYVWAITRDEQRWMPVTLDGEVISERVAALRCGLDASAWQDEERERRCQDLLGVAYTDTDARKGVPLPFDLIRAHQLYQAFFGELEPLLRNKHLMLVSSGPLASLPFAALVTAEPEQALPPLAGYRNAAWLGIRQAITILPSVASLQALRKGSGPSSGQERFIGWGDPDLSGTPSCPRVVMPTECPGPTAVIADGSRAQSRAASGSARGLLRNGLADVDTLRMACPLPDTAHELRCVARSVGASDNALRLGAAATEAAVKSTRLEHYRVIHFATHGLLARETGSVSSGLPEPALLMTPPSRPSKQDDGLLTASEIAQLKLDAEWVILSACNTAAAGHAESEMLSGLARGFFYAGARAVLVSHWAVDSDAAVKLTSRALAELGRSGGIGRGEAMRRSMAALVEDGAPHESHPSYWAPFVIVGEGGR